MRRCKVFQDIVSSLAALDPDIADAQRRIPWHEGITLTELERHGFHVEMVYALIQRARAACSDLDPDDE